VNAEKPSTISENKLRLSTQAIYIWHNIKVHYVLPSPFFKTLCSDKVLQKPASLLSARLLY